jgi:hypothetical protein
MVCYADGDQVSFPGPFRESARAFLRQVRGDWLAYPAGSLLQLRPLRTGLEYGSISRVM